MAAGYKVLCWYHGIEEAARVGGRGEEGRARFKSLIYLRGDCGRHDDATAGRSGAYSRDGENEGKKKKGNKSTKAYFAAGISAPSHVRHFSWGTSTSPCFLSLSFFRRFFSFSFSLSRLSMSSTGSDRAKIKGCKVMRVSVRGIGRCFFFAKEYYFIVRIKIITE